MSIFLNPGILQTWTPIVTAAAPMTISALAINYAYYYLVGDMVFYDVRVRFTTGGARSLQVNISAPEPMFNPGFNGVGVATIVDAGAVLIGRVATELSVNNIAVLRPDGVNWNLAANQLALAQGFYRKA